MPQSLPSAVESELLIKKSRFIGCIQPVPDRTAAQLRSCAAAQAIVVGLKAQHPDAAHVCWA